MNKLITTLFILIVALSTAAQHYTTAKFMIGDDPAWTSPDFDDSAWRTISLNMFWDKQNVPPATKYGWYRIAVDAPTPGKRLGLPCDKYVKVNLGKIDDYDDSYLNGQLIGKSHHYSISRSYVVPRDMFTTEGNVIAVRVFNAGAPGGMYSGTVNFSDVPHLEGTKIRYNEYPDADAYKCDVSLSNSTPWTVSGTLTLKIYDATTSQLLKTVSKKVKSSPDNSATVTFDYDIKQPTWVDVSYTDAKSGDTLTDTRTLKYILTPATPFTPRFNTAPVFGVRPGSPILYRFGVTGERPMTFRCDSLPDGVTLDTANGILGGQIEQPGDYTFTVSATNNHGTDSQQFTLKVGDTIALTPPMGWNSWNCWGLSISEQRVKESAQAMLDKGLADYGYSYINIDDGWTAMQRNPDGTIAVNDKFPDMRQLGNWLHERGLKFGIYSSPGDYTCGEYLGSYDHESQDADTYNDWGIDYLKYDWCSYHNIHNDMRDRHTLASYIRPYMLMNGHLRRQPRDIFYSLCQYGMANVSQWGHTVDANSWRTTGDITDTWQSVYSIGFTRQDGLERYAGPGRWNDPDMLVVGKVGWSDNLRESRLTADEQYSHISLWALLAANMLIGCNMAELDDFTLNLLCNNEVNAVNQDILGHQGSRAVKNGDIEVWTRPLTDGSTAIGIFNVGSSPIEVDFTYYLQQIGLNDISTLRDLWRQQDLPSGNTVYTIPSHGVRLLKAK